MRIYNKIFKHHNREARILALACLLFGGLFYGSSNLDAFPMPLILQVIGLALIIYSVFLATTYLLREYRVEISENDTNTDASEKDYDLMVFEQKGKRSSKTCHIALHSIRSVKIVTKESLKATRHEKLDGFRYIYDSRFLWSERIEIVADTGDYQSVIYLAADQELYKLLNENI